MDPQHRNRQVCTANCQAYQDTIDYDPTKTSCVDVDACWEPLRETNRKGFFSRQDHVVPHIGPKGRPRTITRDQVDARGLDAPDYDYDAEADLVLERLRFLNDETKAAIEFFDDKTSVAVLWIVAVAVKYGAGLTLERLTWFLVGYTAGELDSTIVVWNEKVKHSLVRPTTVIRDGPRKDEEVLTWAGPNKGVASIKRRDFQPYIRVSAAASRRGMRRRP